MTTYIQCTLTRGTLKQVAFVPKAFAVIGRVVKLKEQGVWTNGWRVTSASSISVAESQLPDSHQDIKSHRKLTGDAERKQPR